MTDQRSPEKPVETSRLSNLPNYLLTVREVTGILKCSAVQFSRMVRRGVISSLPFGKSVRYFNNHFT